MHGEAERVVAGLPEAVLDEVAGVVQALENQYDAFVSGREAALLVDESELPTADELGAELERFLAEQSQDPPQ